MDIKTAEYMEERTKKFRRTEKDIKVLDQAAKAVTQPGSELKMGGSYIDPYIGGGRTAAFRENLQKMINEEIASLKKEMEEI